MNLVDHMCDDFGTDDDGWWVADCTCGFSSDPVPDADIAVDVFVAHVVGQFAIERPPRDVIDDARRAYEQNQPGGRANG